MKGKAIIPLVLGLCVGLVAVKLLFDTLKKAQASNASKQTITAIQAKQDIDAYTEIKPEMVELVTTVDSRFTPAQERITDLKQVIGRVTSKAVPQNAPLLQSMIAPEGTPAGMEGRIPAGFRAVSVEIDEVTGVAYQMKPGDWVDVIVVMDIESGSGKRSKETVAEVILQRVQVAAIGQATTGKPGEGASKVKAAKSATLLVPEDEVPKLHLAQTRGKVTLAMRGDDAVITQQFAKASSNSLLSAMRDALQREQDAAALIAAQKAIPAPAPAPAAHSTEPVAQQPGPPADEPFSVVVYRGSALPMDDGSIQTVMFESKNSGKVLDVAEGPVNHASALMANKGSQRPQGPNRTNAKRLEPDTQADDEMPVEPRNKNKDTVRG